MRHILSTSVIVSLLVIFTDAQTFQYSRGWTNGKRAPPAEPATGALSGAIAAMPRFPAGAMLDKPNDKLVLQRFLKSPCDVRLTNALLLNRNKDLLQQLLAGAADMDGAPQLLFDPENGVGAVGGGVEDGGRFKRGA